MIKKEESLKNLRLFAPNLPEIFKEIYYHLYSNSNMSRAERLAAEMIRILFCKIYDELGNKGEKSFLAIEGDSTSATAERIKKLFRKVKGIYPDVFDKNEQILLDNKSISYVVTRLQNHTLTGSSRDVISESFQAFWGRGLRGEKGQFFTPRNIVRLCVEILGPLGTEKVIDPACGSGGFLVELINYVNKVDVKHNVYGIDKEPDLSKICKAYMAIIGNGHKNIFCEDSLDIAHWKPKIKSSIRNNSFDIVLTNPPFGSKIFIDDPRVLKNYELGHEWSTDSRGGWFKLQSISKQVPQLLFIERCIQLLKPGGKMAIVLPDGVFGNSSDKYVWKYILENSKILAVISLSQEAFLPSTHTKTSVLFLKKFVDLKERPTDYKIFMAIADRVGHDKNGKILFKIDAEGNYVLNKKGEKILDDDLLNIVAKFKEFRQNNLTEQSNLGFAINLSNIENSIFIPSYYNPDTKLVLRDLVKKGKYRVVTIGTLVNEGTISIKRGNEVGSKFYGKGVIPFVRTSDIVNWEIKIDPIKCIPEEIYLKYRDLQDIKEGDILLVADGTFLIGRTALVIKADNKLVIQSHIKRIRCLKPEVLSPYLLLFLLNTEVVQKQIKEKTFVQATISTIGNRIFDIQLPIPKQPLAIKIIREVGKIITMKSGVRKKIENLASISI